MTSRGQVRRQQGADDRSIRPGQHGPAGRAPLRTGAHRDQVTAAARRRAVARSWAQNRHSGLQWPGASQAQALSRGGTGLLTGRSVVPVLPGGPLQQTLGTSELTRCAATGTVSPNCSLSHVLIGIVLPLAHAVRATPDFAAVRGRCAVPTSSASWIGCREPLNATWPRQLWTLVGMRGGRVRHGGVRRGERVRLT
jgi:hypothetical protein